MDAIAHIVVLMLENQSFDRLLGDLKSVQPAVDGVDPAHPGSNPDPDGGAPYMQAPGAPNTTAHDLGHDLDDVLRQTAGNCSGFVADYAAKQPHSGRPERQQVMSYFELGRLPALHALAQNFLVCDRWFSSVPGPTWPNRLFVHSGTSLGHTDMPEGFDPHVHVYNQPTLYERLAEADIPWRIYVGDFSQTWLLTAQWKYFSCYAPMAQFFRDAGGDPARFPAYCFIEPRFFGARQNDQHPPYDILLGEQLLGSVYNALRANPALWATTLFVVLYDEHGGFYDHVDPLAAAPAGLAVPPDDQSGSPAFRRFGVRVPAVLVSPWVDAGVDHTVFDHTSLLRYAIDKWSLGPLGRRAAAANSIAPLLARRQAPRPDAPASVPLPIAAVAGAAAGLNRNQNALLAFSQFAETHLVPALPETVLDRIRRSFLGAEPLAQVMAERAADLMKS